MKIKEMFDEYAEKFGTVEWNGVKLALTQDAYRDGSLMNWYFVVSAMDKDGNRWDVFWDIFWYSSPDADECDDRAVPAYAEPAYAKMVDVGYYLD